MGELIDSTLLDRITKFIRLLGSDKDGEVLASVRAMDRVLKSNDLTFNSVAELLKSDLADIIYEAGYAEGREFERKQSSRPPWDDDDDTPADWRSLGDDVDEPVWRHIARFCYDAAAD